MTIVRFFVVSLFLSICWYYYQSSALLNFVDTCLVIALVGSIFLGGYRALTKRLYLDFIRRPLDRVNLEHTLSVLNKWVLLLLIGWTIKISTPTFQFTERGASLLFWGTLSLIGCLMLLALLMPRKVDRMVNAVVLLGSFVFAYEINLAHSSPLIEDSVILASPFDETFYVINGGRSRLNNTLAVSSRENRKNGIYLFPTKEPYMSAEANPQDYPSSFGTDVFAPLSGEVVGLIEDIADDPMGVTSNDHGPGNYLLIKVNEGQFLCLSHLQEGSISVSLGDRVREGQFVGKCGKSGMVSIPALFVAVFNTPDFFDPQARSYPIYIRGVGRVGEVDPQPHYYPKRNDLFQPIGIEL